MDQRVVAEVLDVFLDARVLAVLLELLQSERVDQRVCRLGRAVLERRLNHGRAGVRVAAVSANEELSQLSGFFALGLVLHALMVDEDDFTRLEGCAEGLPVRLG